MLQEAPQTPFCRGQMPTTRSGVYADIGLAGASSGIGTDGRSEPANAAQRSPQNADVHTATTAREKLHWQPIRLDRLG